MFRIRLLLLLASLLLAALAPMAAHAAEPVTVTVTKVDDKDVIQLENYRVRLRISPARGGAITSYSDKLAPAELILQKRFQGLCMDHFQEQNWPGELLEVPYDYTIVKQTPEEVVLTLKRVASGIWQGKLANKLLSNITLEKTYLLRADSPAVICRVKLSVPADEPKVFSYWIQHVFFAGGDYDAATDRTFRPAARGIRNTGAEKNGPYGKEEWLRDFTGGWMALVDTVKKTGLATISDYNDLRINYACGGNVTNELMFNTTYVPKGQSRTYTVALVPETGLDNVLYAGAEALLGYHITTDNRGAGQLQLSAVRSEAALQGLTLTVSIASAEGGKEVAVGAVTFAALTDAVQTQTLALTGIPTDPIVVRVAATGTAADGTKVAFHSEDFFPGAYKWADNIQTDMRSPLYSAPRPPQKLTLAKPAVLHAKKSYEGRHLFFEGVQDDAFDVAGAVKLAGYEQKTDTIYYRYNYSWYGELSDFPYDYDKLLGYDCIILGGVSSSGLKPIGLEMLHDYLQAGGGMVILGSFGGYGRSQLFGSALGNAFPVTFSKEIMDLRPTGGKPLTIGPDNADFLAFTALSPQASCYFLHPATAKPGTKVLLQTGGQPFMVTGEYGPNKARIVCILGAALGSPAHGQTPFWQDAQWTLMLRNAIWWASHRDEHFKVD